MAATRLWLFLPLIVERALPDTAAWRNKLAYNEPMVNYYLRHPAFRDIRSSVSAGCRRTTFANGALTV